MVSKKSRNIMDNCRFCWMCRHICPVGHYTGLERNTARARMLALSMVERGEDISMAIDNVYECMCCGACTKECVTGFDPVYAVMEVRKEAALSGKTPGYIGMLVDKIGKSGNVYGKKSIDKDLTKTIKSVSRKTDTLFLLGPDVIYKEPSLAVKAIELLKKSGTGFTVLEKEPNTGAVLYFLLGEVGETRETAEKAAAVLNSYEKIIIYEPFEAKVIIQQYRVWGIRLTAKICTFTAFLSELIKNKLLKPAKTKEKYTYQDASALARDLEETKPAENIIDSCGVYKPMLLHGKDTFSAGNLIMNEYMPDVMKGIASKRWENVPYTEADTMITSSTAEYLLLKQTAPKGKKVMALEELVLKSI